MAGGGGARDTHEALSERGCWAPGVRKGGLGLHDGSPHSLGTPMSPDLSTVAWGWGCRGSGMEGASSGLRQRWARRVDGRVPASGSFALPALLPPLSLLAQLCFLSLCPPHS